MTNVNCNCRGLLKKEKKRKTVEKHCFCSPFKKIDHSVRFDSLNWPLLPSFFHSYERERVERIRVSSFYERRKSELGLAAWCSLECILRTHVQRVPRGNTRKHDGTRTDDSSRTRATACARSRAGFDGHHSSVSGGESSNERRDWLRPSQLSGVATCLILGVPLSKGTAITIIEAWRRSTLADDGNYFSSILALRFVFRSSKITISSMGTDVWSIDT